jgi:signal transduction histidine kinase/CheY-like chemotaxis protein
MVASTRTNASRATTILTLIIRYEHDIVIARQRSRQIASLLGFDPQDQVRLATAVSEIARNAYTYANGGKVEFVLEDTLQGQSFVIRITDEGPGIADVEGILEGRFKSKGGMGLGIIGTRRLMDYFHLDSTPGKGTTVLLGKRLPPKAPRLDSKDIATIVAELARLPAQTAFEEIQRQNQELMRILEELRVRQEELINLNRELEDTNRGVLALYAELDDKAQHIRRADELKSRFLSNMSHEFRTPLNSILALTRLLLERADGPLTEEQEKQVNFIRKAASDLSELVNDLLDIAKVEAGKVVVRPGEFDVSTLFSTLRGMLRPLLVNPSLNLVFDEPSDIPRLFTDEGKVSQILRNLISNAIKFTPRGEVRVSAALSEDRSSVIFSVSDTGIGIAPEDQERIFEEFTQIEHPLQKRTKGTGLGLPLTKKLAELLGGSINVKSEVGMGSTFSVRIPLTYSETKPQDRKTDLTIDPSRLTVLVVEDDPETMLLYEKYLKKSDFQVIAAQNLTKAREILKSAKPFAIVLDILIPGQDTWGFLAEIKANEETREIPVLVISVLDEKKKGMTLGAEDFWVKPIERNWLIERLRDFQKRRPVKKILVIDDEEISRYLIRSYTSELSCKVIEAPSGKEGIRKAVEEKPEVIFLDLIMPEMDGFETLNELKRNPLTCEIPVIVITSKVLMEEERKRLEDRVTRILSKETASRESVMAEVERILAAKRKEKGL